MAFISIKFLSGKAFCPFFYLRQFTGFAFESVSSVNKGNLYTRIKFRGRSRLHRLRILLAMIFTFKLILLVMLDTQQSFLPSEIIYLTILV